MNIDTVSSTPVILSVPRRALTIGSMEGEVPLGMLNTCGEGDREDRRKSRVALATPCTAYLPWLNRHLCVGATTIGPRERESILSLL